MDYWAREFSLKESYSDQINRNNFLLKNNLTGVSLFIILSLIYVPVNLKFSLCSKKIKLILLPKLPFLCTIDEYGALLQPDNKQMSTRKRMKNNKIA